MYAFMFFWNALIHLTAYNKRQSTFCSISLFNLFMTRILIAHSFKLIVRIELFYYEHDVF